MKAYNRRSHEWKGRICPKKKPSGAKLAYPCNSTEPKEKKEKKSTLNFSEDELFSSAMPSPMGCNHYQDRNYTMTYKLTLIPCTIKHDQAKQMTML